MRPKLPSPPGGLALALFWAAVLSVISGGVAVLQVLGPPGQRVPLAAAPAPPAAASLAPALRAAGAPVPGPDPDLLEPSHAFPEGRLPRIAPDGRRPMDAYAAGWNRGDKRPRVAVLLTGFGFFDADSLNAIHDLPPSVSLAMSPYAPHPEIVLATARAAGHEVLVSIPMDSPGIAPEELGAHALLAAYTPAQNAVQLEWVLSRFAGYVGATGALEGMRGEVLAAQDESFAAVAGQIGARGLIYIDPRPGHAPSSGAGRAVDLILDAPPTRLDIEARLAQLERIAREHGSALGLAGPLLPLTVSELGAWAGGLYARGISLVPVSALVPANRIAEIRQ